MSHEDAETALQKRLDLIRAARGNAVPLDDVAEVVRAILDTMSGEVSANELRVYNELESLAEVIRRAKQEIADIRPDEIKDEFLPTAADELDAIVQSTETAANTILDAVEAIEAVIPTVDAKAGEALTNATMQIYEGCNFQDLTGQRISKVVNTLKQIETRVNALVSAFGAEIEGALKTGRGKGGEVADTREDAHLLNGPQHPGLAASQDDIDALLAGGAAGAAAVPQPSGNAGTQDDIDALLAGDAAGAAAEPQPSGKAGSQDDIDALLASLS
jgi:chemotaxis protein CheZ